MVVTAGALGVSVASDAGAVTIQAADNDGQNKLWDCVSNPGHRVGYGNRDIDKVRCFTFRYAVPGGITSAVLHLSLEPLGGDQATDSVFVAVGSQVPGCDVFGEMAGCVTVHGAFPGAAKTLTIDLLNLNCNPWFAGKAPRDQQDAVAAQVRTGVLHAILQDDTALVSAQLVLNEGAPAKCGTSTDPGPPVVGGGTSTTGGSQGGSGVTLPTPPFGTPEPAPTATRMTLQAGQRNVRAGDTVWVPVMMIKGTDVANINYEITYDASVAVAERGLGRGAFFGNALQQGNTETAGIVRIGAAQTTAENGTNVIAYMKFRAVGQPGAKTALKVTVSKINNPAGTNLTIDRIDGLVQIVGPDGLLPGDCDGKGYLSEADALCALQMSVKLIPERLVVDVDKDGSVTSRDAAVILQRVVGTA